jgi:hypothetical protein
VEEKTFWYSKQEKELKQKTWSATEDEMENPSSTSSSSSGEESDEEDEEDEESQEESEFGHGDVEETGDKAVLSLLDDDSEEFLFVAEDDVQSFRFLSASQEIKLKSSELTMNSIEYARRPPIFGKMDSREAVPVGLLSSESQVSCFSFVSDSTAYGVLGRAGTNHDCCHCLCICASSYTTYLRIQVRESVREDSCPLDTSDGSTLGSESSFRTDEEMASIEKLLTFVDEMVENSEEEMTPRNYSPLRSYRSEVSVCRCSQLSCNNRLSRFLLACVIAHQPLSLSLSLSPLSHFLFPRSTHPCTLFPSPLPPHEKGT